MTSWEFNCPQFVDFEAGLMENSTDAWFENLNQNQRKIHLKKKDFGPRMATPKCKPIKNFRNSPFVNANRPLKTDDEKLEALGAPLRKSKSFCSLDRKVNLKTSEKYSIRTKENNQRKRSLSENCLKIEKKVYPITPKCLKRTLHQAKSKKAKTTEEMELEKITELQNRLLQHLKLNEINLKRIKMNKPPVVISNFGIKTNCNNIKNEENKDMNAPLQKLARSKSVNRKATHGEENFIGASKKTHAEILKIKLNKLSSVLKSENIKPSIPTNVLRDINSNREEKTDTKKKIPTGLYYPHSGLMFMPNKSKTIPHPFSFDSSNASSINASFQMFSTPANKSCVINKENIRHQKL